MTDDEIIDRLRHIYLEHGARTYGLTAVTQSQHALQCATLAERQGADAALIAAALLHDLGHMIDGADDVPAERGIDDLHEAAGARWLAEWFGPEVTEPIRQHVAAKRYLCAVETGYRDGLSADSERSLKLQGGPMSEAECRTFETLPHNERAVQLRRLDEAGKDPTAETPHFDHFVPALRAAMARVTG